jgi:hypothetical protein
MKTKPRPSRSTPTRAAAPKPGNSTVASLQDDAETFNFTLTTLLAELKLPVEDKPRQIKLVEDLIRRGDALAGKLQSLRVPVPVV